MTDGQDRTPEDFLAEVRAIKAVPDAPADTYSGQVQDADYYEVDGFQDLDAFFDDHLPLPIRGKVYRVPPASAELGLLCSRLVMAGETVATGGTLKKGQVAQLNDDEEATIYERLLGHEPTLAGTGREEVLCDGGHPIDPDNPDSPLCDGGEVLVEEVPDAPNPAYDPAEDVWEQLWADGIDWQRIQHVGATAMIWTAVGKAAAQQFWASGARPKASAQQPPRTPQDHRPKGSGKSGRPDSTGGTTNRKTKAKAKPATAGTASSSAGA